MVNCDNCGKEAVLIELKEDGRPAYVCHDCKRFIGYQIETYSRVVGYLRPINQWNVGKKKEFKDRKNFDIPVEK